MVDVTWARDSSDKTHSAPFAANAGAVFGKIQELSPHNDNQRFLQSQALSMAISIGQIRSLMFAQKTSSVPMPLLAVLVFWLILLFISFGLIRSSQRDGGGQPIRLSRWRFALRSS